MNIEQLTLDRAGRKAVAVEILQFLDYLPEYIRQFEVHDRLFCSMGGMAGAYDLTDEQKKKVAEIEAEYNITVYALQSGRMRIDAEESDYLCCLYTDNEEVKIAKANIEAGRPVLTDICDELTDDLGYRLFAYVEAWDDDLGTVGIKGKNGGIIRTC